MAVGITVQRRRIGRCQRKLEGFGEIAQPLQLQNTEGIVSHIGTGKVRHDAGKMAGRMRSEEHTSELQSRENLVCRLLLEKKNNEATPMPTTRTRHCRS